MCDNCFHDRRPHSAPGEGDFVEPLSRQSVAKANSRLRLATPDYHRSALEQTIRDQTVQRHRARQAGRGDFDSVGSYLEHMATR